MTDQPGRPVAQATHELKEEVDTVTKQEDPAGDEKVITLDPRMFFGVLAALVAVTVAAQYLAGQATDDNMAHVLMTIGIVLIAGAAFEAAARLAATYKVKSADGFRTQAIDWVPLTELVKALTAAPMWIAMFTLGGILLVGSAFFDGYDGFGVEVTTRDDHRDAHGTAVASEKSTFETAEAGTNRTITAEATAHERTVAADATAHERTIVAEATAHARNLEFVDRGVLPTGFSLVPTPVTVPAETADASPSAGTSAAEGEGSP